MEQPDVLALTGMYGEEAVEAGIVSDDAVKLVLKVCHPDDLDTEVFKSDCAFTSIPEIDLEVCSSILNKMKSEKAPVLIQEDPGWTFPFYDGWHAPSRNRRESAQYSCYAWFG